MGNTGLESDLYREAFLVGGVSYTAVEWLTTQVGKMFSRGRE